MLEILSGHEKELAAFGTKRIGLSGALYEICSPACEIDLMVDLHQDKNNFHNFMSLVAFLEKVLNHKVNLLLMQPRYPYIPPQILEKTTFIWIEGSPAVVPRSILPGKAQQRPGIQKEAEEKEN